MPDPDNNPIGALEQATQVRRFQHTHRLTVGRHHGPLRRRRRGYRELKAKPGGELQVHGSGEFVRWLFAHELVDEMMLLVYPVVVGQGTRLFPDAGPDAALELVDSQSTHKGVTIQVYRLAGRPQYAT